MRRYNIVLAVVIVTCVLAGFVLEHLFGESGANRGLMFQRSGALVVLLGTAYGLLDGAGIMRIGDLFTAEQIAEIQAAQGRQDLVAIINKKADLMFAAMTARGYLYRYSATVLALGTLIWGFGDVGYRFLFP